MRPEERERREQQRLAALSRRSTDLGTLKGVAEDVEARALVAAEKQLYMRCGGCGERIGVGLHFSRFEVVAGPEGKPVVNRLRLAACNGAQGCDYAKTCREGADLVEMVEFVWLTGDSPVAGGELSADVERSEAAARAVPRDEGGPAAAE